MKDISRKTMGKPQNISSATLPPIVAPTNDECLIPSVPKDQNDFNDYLKLSPINTMAEKKSYDPKLYSSSNHQDEIQDPTVSTADELQTEIDEFFKTHDLYIVFIK
jgi:hypothetical protein